MVSLPATGLPGRNPRQHLSAAWRLAGKVLCAAQNPYCPHLSAKRRKTAKALGLGEKLQKGLQKARKSKAKAAAAVNPATKKKAKAKKT